MLRKLLVFAITSGLAAKLYKNYVRKHPMGGRAVTDRNMRRDSPLTKGDARSEG